MPGAAYHSSTLAALSPEEREAWLSSLSPDELEHLNYDWRFWARPEQIAPEGNWFAWLFLAGRGAGKTRSAAEWVRENVCGNTPLAPGRYSRLALVAETAADARDVLVDGQSGLLAIHPKAFRPIYEVTKRRVTWPNGAIATLYNATEPDQLRGPQHEAAWLDELAKWRYAQETWDMLQFGLRLGNNPRQVVTTTPRPIPLIRELLKRSDVAVTRGSTFDNAANLAAGFLHAIKQRYEGTRLGRQELRAEILDDVPGALWTTEMIDAALKPVKLPDMQRVVVAVDPSGTKGSEDGGDWIGIVAAGKGVDGRGYVLGDYSCKLSPAGWGRRAVECFHRFKADAIVGEINFGGAMVEHVIRSVDRNVPYVMVRASRGKVLRAEPVAALYEQGRVSHAESFPELETQMCAFTNTGYLGDGSPDRADACFAGGTLVTTELGEKKIADIVCGDRVLTRDGFKNVVWAGQTNISSACYRLDLSNGLYLIGTAEHPIFSMERYDFIPLSDLREGEELFPLYEDRSCKKPQSRLSFWERLTAVIPIVPTKQNGAITFVRTVKVLKRCTELFGNIITGPFQKERKFTTKTKTGLITNQIISNALRESGIVRRITAIMRKFEKPVWTTPEFLLLSGMVLTRDALGTRNTANRLGLAGNGKQLRLAAPIATAKSKHSSPKKKDLDTARVNAGWRLQGVILRTMKTIFARFAEKLTRFLSGGEARSKKPARVFVVRRSESGMHPVYNLHVEGQREFVANGVLVHNCVHAISELNFNAPPAGAGIFELESRKAKAREEARAKFKAKKEEADAVQGQLRLV